MTAVEATPARPRKLAGAALAQAEAVVPSAELGPEPELAWLGINLLSIDTRYQRPLGKDNLRLVNNIVRNFDWSKCAPLVVAAVKGGDGYVIIDGQHPWEAAKRHGGIPRLPCSIIFAPALVDQAAAFVALNGDRIAVHPLARFHARIAAGDERASRVARLCAQAGVKIARTPGSYGYLAPCTTVSPGMIEKRLELGDQVILRALSLLAAAQPDTPNVFSAAAIEAMVHIVATHGGAIEHTRIVQALAKFNFAAELQAAKVTRAESGGRMWQALQRRIVAAYNRRPGEKLPT